VGVVEREKALNRQKGSQTPATWKPPDRAGWCAYAHAWSGVKERWGLSVATDEQAALSEMQAGCSSPAPASVEFVERGWRSY
jgi:hypothetical protein